MIEWFLPLMQDLLTNLAPVAFLIFAVTYAMDFILNVAFGRNRRP